MKSAVVTSAPWVQELKRRLARLLLLATVACSCAGGGQSTVVAASAVSADYFGAFAAFLRWNQLGHAVIVRAGRVSQLEGCATRLALRALMTAHHTLWWRISSGGAPDERPDFERAFYWSSRRVGVFVEVLATGSACDAFAQGSRGGYFNGSQAWFICVDFDGVERSATLQRWANAVFGRYAISVDADITLALQMPNDTLALYELFRMGSDSDLPLRLQRKGEWSPAEGLRIGAHWRRSFVRRRNDFGNLTLSAATAILERPSHMDSLSYLANEVDDKQLDMMQRKTYHLLQLLGPMWNLSFSVVFKEAWGTQRAPGEWTGVIGAILAGDAEFAICPIRFTSERLRSLRFAPDLHTEYIPFLFRHPRRNPIRNIFFEPLTPTVWLCVLGLIILSILLLVVLTHWDARLRRALLEARRLDYVVLLILEAFFLQGPSPNVFGGTSARQLVLWLCVFSFMLMQFYSGFIVSSLLAVAPRSITTLTALYNSSLELGMEDIAYNFEIFENATDPFVRQLYAQRICRPDCRDRVTTIERGARRIRRGGFAFHVSANRMLYLLKSLLSDDEFCDLQQINMAPPYQSSAALAKGSSYREHLAAGILQLRTTGLMQHNNAKWQTPPTDCNLNQNREVGVDLEHFVPALAFLALAHALAVCALLLELGSKWIARRRRVWPPAGAAQRMPPTPS